tara:strand:+ start:4219 stop:5430 length:1212 start_codon:yes stop_codon:yes gene_type:complete
MASLKVDKTLINIAAKKALGKAHTSTLSQTQNETIPSNVQVTTETTFGESVPNTVDISSFWSIQSGTVEYLEFDVSPVIGSSYDEDSYSGYGGSESSDNTEHGYYLKLPADYETSSSNSLAGTGFFVDGQRVYDTRGKLQLVPPFLSNAGSNKYNLTLYNAGDTRIMPGDDIDWTIDYYNGIIFVQDPQTDNVPTKARAFLYIGKMADEATGGNVRIMGTSSLGQATDITAVTKITFDGTTGLNVTASSATEAIVSLGSHFNPIQVTGQDTLHATGSEALEIAAGSGISLSTNKSSTPKKLTITAIPAFTRAEITASTTSSTSYEVLGVNATGTLEIRLPSASTYASGQYFTIKDEAGNADTYNITVRASGSETIDGMNSIILESPHAAVNIYCNGTNKFFIY